MLSVLRVMKFRINVLTEASMEATPPKWQNTQVDQVEWSRPTGSLKHKFSVIIDEGCQDAFSRYKHR